MTLDHVRPSLGRVVCTALALCLAAAPARAQEPSGFWASAGLGTGMHQLSCDVCLGEYNGGWAARVALGGTLSDHLRLGGEVQGWTDGSEGIRSTFLAVAPTLYWYPSPARTRYFVMGGVGLARFRASDSTDALSASSLGVMLGVGYEVRIGRAYALTPFAGFSNSFFANLRDDQTLLADVRLTLLHLGLSVTRL